MENKYYEAICALSELLLDAKSDNDCKRLILNDRNKEIEQLKAKIAVIEQARE